MVSATSWQKFGPVRAARVASCWSLAKSAPFGTNSTDLLGTLTKPSSFLPHFARRGGFSATGTNIYSLTARPCWKAERQPSPGLPFCFLLLGARAPSPANEREARRIKKDSIFFFWKLRARGAMRARAPALPVKQNRQVRNCIATLRLQLYALQFFSVTLILLVPAWNNSGE